MAYEITYKASGKNWHKKILTFTTPKNMLQHLDNLKKKGYTNIIASEYFYN